MCTFVKIIRGNEKKIENERPIPIEQKDIIWGSREKKAKIKLIKDERNSL